MNIIKMDSDSWMELKYPGKIVLDPDGWDRTDFINSWAELITEDEFDYRYVQSTVMLKEPI